MFNIMVFVLVMAFYLALVIAVLMLIYRIYLGVTHQGSIKEKTLIIILPLGIGVFLHVKKTLLIKIYRIAIIVLFITSIVASLFLFHRELGL